MTTDQSLVTLLRALQNPSNDEEVARLADQVQDMLQSLTSTGS